MVIMTMMIFCFLSFLLFIFFSFLLLFYNTLPYFSSLVLSVYKTFLLIFPYSSFHFVFFFLSSKWLICRWWITTTPLRIEDLCSRCRCQCCCCCWYYYLFYCERILCVITIEKGISTHTCNYDMLARQSLTLVLVSQIHSCCWVIYRSYI